MLGTDTSHTNYAPLQSLTSSISVLFSSHNALRYLLVRTVLLQWRYSTATCSKLMMCHGVDCFPCATKLSICDSFKILLSLCLIFFAHSCFLGAFMFSACVSCLISHVEGWMHIIPFTTGHNIYVHQQYFIRTDKRAGNWRMMI